MAWVFAVLAVSVVVVAWWVGEGHGGELADLPPRRTPAADEQATQEQGPA